MPRFPLLSTCFAIVVGFPLTLPLATAQEANPSSDELTIDAVVTGLQKTEASVETLAVVYTGKITRDFQADFEASGARVTVTEQWHIDAQGRGYNDAKGNTKQNRSDGGSRDNDFHKRSSFDGTEGRSWEITSTGMGKESHSGSVQPNLEHYALSPFDLTIRHQGTFVSECLADGGTIVGTQEWDGHKVTLIETKPVVANGEYKAEYWIDPARDFVVVRRRNLTRSGPDASWHVTSSVDGFKHKRIAANLWVPQIAWTQWFTPPKDDSELGHVMMRRDLRCDQWKVNEPLDESKLRLTFPPGLKVHGLAKANDATPPSKNFFVQPITTPLQRRLLRSDKYDVYAGIDVTAYTDVNTQQIDPTRFDFAAFQKELKASLNHVGAKHASVFLQFQHGALSTDRILGRFTRAPVIAIAKDAGFPNVRFSNTYSGGGGHLWQGLAAEPEKLIDGQDKEQDRGDADWSVYLVGTRLSSTLSDGFDCLIMAKADLPLDTRQLLDDDAISSIRQALSKVDIADKSVNLTLRLGDPRTDPAEGEELPAIKKGTRIQIEAVDALREIGFRSVRLTIQIGYTNNNADYR